MGAKYVCKHGVFNQWCKLCADKYPSGQPRNPVNDLKEAEGMNLLYKHDSEEWSEVTASTTICHLIANVPQVNIYSGGTWQWLGVQSNWYFAYWVVASSSQNYPIFLVPGQEESTSPAGATDGNFVSAMDFGGLPTQEHKVIARII